jgi:hypothetical protein
MEPEMVVLYYEAFERLKQSLHPDHRGSFHLAFHLYKNNKAFQKAQWINADLRYVEYDLWSTDDLMNDFEMMVQTSS